MCVWDALCIERAATSEMRWQLSFVLASEDFLHQVDFTTRSSNFSQMQWTSNPSRALNGFSAPLFRRKFFQLCEALCNLHWKSWSDPESPINEVRTLLK